MRRLIGSGALVLMATILGCGSDAGDRQVLSFVGFTGEGITQADAVLDTHAEVDICLGLCIEEDEVDAEPFTQTTVNAMFVNRGKADILLDEYTLFASGSGIDPITRRIGRLIPGGRCADDPQRACAVDEECLAGSCRHQETAVSLLFYDFDFKDRVLLGQCPTFELDPVTGEISFDPGLVTTQTLDVFLTFTGIDDRNERFTISAGYQSTFDDFDNCEE